MKRYDRDYFERWYRNPKTRIRDEGELKRKALLAVAVTEHVTRRGIRNALDIGCGEGRWARELRRIRPSIRYTGLETSRYAIERYGQSRNIREGGFGDLGHLRLGGEFDLVICTDVMHYLTGAEIDRGLPAIAKLLRGALYVDAATREDAPEGDLVGWQDRPASWYRTRLERAGLVELGLGCWARDDSRGWLTAMEVR